MIRGDYFHYRYFKRNNYWDRDIDLRINNQRAVPVMTKNGTREFHRRHSSSDNTKWEFKLASGTKMMLGHSLYYSSIGKGKDEE